MICLWECDSCIHARDEKVDGWIFACDAFPKGMPMDFDMGRVREMKECNNGIGYEEKEENHGSE